MSKVLIGLSGGADSAGAVILLQQQGYEVIGGVLDLSPAFQKAVETAKAASAALRIPLTVITAHDLFDREVVLPFCHTYRAGRTPNPCVLCNPAVKFRLLLEEADRQDCGWIATGHYARTARYREETVIRKAVCSARDQSYMLYGLTREQRERLLLPLGEVPDKETVRAMGRERRLSAADAPDSQEICFLPNGGIGGYIESRLGKELPGRFIAPDGSVYGPHPGISHYTVGQRKGLGVALGRPVFIRAIDPDTRDIFLADAGGEFFPEMKVTQERWQIAPPDAPLRCQVKVRSMARPADAVRFPDGRVVFDQPQRAPAPGQAAVYYDGEYVLGGGLIV